MANLIDKLEATTNTTAIDELIERCEIVLKQYKAKKGEICFSNSGTGEVDYRMSPITKRQLEELDKLILAIREI